MKWAFGMSSLDRDLVPVSWKLGGEYFTGPQEEVSKDNWSTNNISSSIYYFPLSLPPVGSGPPTFSFPLVTHTHTHTYIYRGGGERGRLLYKNLTVPANQKIYNRNIHKKEK